jgi:PadR family transcriptional regulator, regulatory protein PadR
MKAQLLKGQLDARVLSVLEQEPAHGYAIMRRLQRRSDEVFRFSEGTLYPALHRLERDRMVKSRWTADRGRRRRVYRITLPGREALAVRRLEWKTFARAVESVLAASGEAASSRR